MIFGKYPYQKDGFDINLFYQYSGQQSNFDINSSNDTITYHIDMQE